MWLTTHSAEQVPGGLARGHSHWAFFQGSAKTPGGPRWPLSDAQGLEGLLAEAPLRSFSWRFLQDSLPFFLGGLHVQRASPSLQTFMNFLLHHLFSCLSGQSEWHGEFRLRVGRDCPPAWGPDSHDCENPAWASSGYKGMSPVHEKHANHQPGPQVLIQSRIRL